ncbi:MULTISPECIES: enolase C-terminal domain-like protein [Ramlibacter]|uniref:Mandelate racemase n=1 Tax=Ramlibacter pinisoli TaxID=2682844 RepID=A0A6N8J1W7_9BURK|nr:MULTISPECIES: enolase C-terminal domain-like protein [Ramlibacter]MBA2962338.1 mandelate racemase [Ramlibacter sp. CGMCC 1.13660]MVQ32280.1 mandelate racemase [Ramlibacter pinisoli]
MRIVDIRELSVQLEGAVANAVVNFSEHTVSLVAVVTDVVRGGKPVIGLGFNSIGRFAQSGIIRTRMIPRLLAAEPASLLAEGGQSFDAAKVLATILRNEKPGGHGDRAGAAAAIEQAIWDLNAKLADEPAYRTIARAFGREPVGTPVEVYTGGGYYYAPGAGRTIRDEFMAYREMGFESFKMKIGGAPLAQDMKRIDEALQAAGGPDRLMVDANGRFDLPTALAYARELKPLGLRWFEEIGDPLDYQLNREVVESYGGPVATGENLFSAIDTLNLVRFGGMRPNLDIFQMDSGLSYGITEYARMIGVLESHGFDRRQAVPHGGHLINLHVVVGLGLGACEAYPGVFQPFGGYSPECEIRHAKVRPSDAAGFGLEQKRELLPFIRELTA